MFEAAFLETGAQGGRPTAQQWVQELDRVRAGLKRCGNSVMHHFPTHLTACPWCQLEKQAGIDYFPSLVVTFRPSPGNFVLAQVWALIESGKPPPALEIPVPIAKGLNGVPLPAGVSSATSRTIKRVLVVAAALGLVAMLPKAALLILLAAAVLFFSVGSGRGAAHQAELTKRRTAREVAEREYDSVVNRLRETGPEGFHLKRRKLADLKTEYQGLGTAESDEVEHLKATASSRQLKQFLERQHIDNANIPGVGSALKAALRSFGIEAAADVSWSRVHAVRGFGDVKTRAVVDWKHSWERRFKFNPAAAVTAADRAAVAQKYAARKAAIETQLSLGAADLQRFQAEASSKRAGLLPQVTAAAQKLAQAQADLALL